jgi:hypothetical protein
MKGCVRVPRFGLVLVAITAVLALAGWADAQTKSPPADPAATAKAAPKAPALQTGGTRAIVNAFNASCATGNVDAVHGQAGCTLFTVPAGRQVVIESISCQVEIYAGDGPGDIQLVLPSPSTTGGGPMQVSHFLTLTKQASGNNLDIWRMTTPLRAYAIAPAGGTTGIGLFFRANPSRPRPQDAFCTISGYIAAP